MKQNNKKIEKNKLNGLDGWLALVGIGLILTPIAELISGITIFTIGISLWWIYIIFLFFTKKKIFPKYFIITKILYVVIFIFLVIIKNTSSIFIEGLAQNTLSACIWIPYMLVSKRVKATFIK